MIIRYLSHSSFEIRNSKTVLIDPFFSGNKLSPPYTGLPDYVLVTHEHFDHADASRFSCDVVCPPNCKFKKQKIMRIGDAINLDGIKIQMLASSHHQSAYATGYLIEFEGNVLYHPGDTYLDAIKNLGRIDVFFVPIGGTYTMNVDEAVKALSIIKPRIAIPMHYGTLPEIKADPEEFKRKAVGFDVRIMKVGEELEV